MLRARFRVVDETTFPPLVGRLALLRLYTALRLERKGS
jgi:hypothetical protein